MAYKKETIVKTIEENNKRNGKYLPDCAGKAEEIKILYNDNLKASASLRSPLFGHDSRNPMVSKIVRLSNSDKE